MKNIKSIPMKSLFFLLIFLVCNAALPLFGQEYYMANEYYETGDYEKAIGLYEKLLKTKEYASLVHHNYFDAFLKLEKYEQAERYIKKCIKDKPEHFEYVADYAMLLRKMKRENEYNKLIDDLVRKVVKEGKGDPSRVANAFVNNELADAAEKVLEPAYEINRFNLYLPLAHVYSILGKTEKMFEVYLDFIHDNENEAFVNSLITMLSQRLSSQEDYDRLETQLLRRAQKYPDRTAYMELAVWVYMQKKDWSTAFSYAKAVDKRRKLEGAKIFEIGSSALTNQDYKSAVKIFDYLVEKYEDSPNFYNYKLNSMKAKEEMVKNDFPINMDNVRSLVKDYNELIQKYGINFRTYEFARNLAQLQAFYLGNRDSAIFILEKVVELGKQNPKLISKAKLDLGDIYLLKNEWWEATLLYSQVEKSEKEADIGHMAKLKNAKLHYYRGNFQLAKEHLDILKLATSREISNDAMSLSLLITENTGLDTSEVALQEYADAELLIFQQQNEKAAVEYERLARKYKGHSLEDDILWQLANLNMKMGKMQEAVKYFEQILKDFPDDVHGDNANYMLGYIHEEYLKDKDKAMTYYEEHLLKYPGSIFSVEARKRYRDLRGDKNFR
jgi:tetratricopeptide (TPR) repeat protein